MTKKAYPAQRRNGQTYIPVKIHGKVWDLENLLEKIREQLCDCCCEGETSCVRNYVETLRHVDDVLPVGDTQSKKAFEVEEAWIYYINGKILVTDSQTGNSGAASFSFVVSRAAAAAAAFETDIADPAYDYGSVFVPGVAQAFNELDDFATNVKWTVDLNGNDIEFTLTVSGGGYDETQINSNIMLNVAALCFPLEGDAEGY